MFDIEWMKFIQGIDGRLLDHDRDVFFYVDIYLDERSIRFKWSDIFLLESFQVKQLARTIERIKKCLQIPDIVHTQYLNIEFDDKSKVCVYTNALMGSRKATKWRIYLRELLTHLEFYELSHKEISVTLAINTHKNDKLQVNALVELCEPTKLTEVFKVDVKREKLKNYNYYKQHVISRYEETIMGALHYIREALQDPLLLNESACRLTAGAIEEV